MKFEILTHDQQHVFNVVENTNANIFIGGKPGVGKTVLIHALTEFGQKPYTKGAPTGLAALNAGAKTLHSLFAIPVSNGIIPPDYNKYTNNPDVRAFILHRVHHLIIDEISMVRVDILAYIERLLREIKQVDKPFGGVQIICVGDFFQLPPVVNKEDKTALLKAGWRSEFAFDESNFASFKRFELTEVLRQKDAKFISILHSARTGEIKNAQLSILNKRVDTCTDFRVRLTATNKQAEEVNLAHLKAIDSPLVEFHANSFGTWPQFPCDTILGLKVGAQVLIKMNAADRPPGTKGKFNSTVVNGSLGIVREIFPKTETEAAYVAVELKNGDTVSIFTQRWEQKIKEKIGSQWTERVVASFEQIPLQLAWAISMHKSQGQSFDAVHIDASRIFAAGQLYVALSRTRTLEGVSFQSRVQARSFFADKRVLEFDKQLKMETV